MHLSFSQSAERPPRYGERTRLATRPSQPDEQARLSSSAGSPARGLTKDSGRPPELQRRGQQGLTFNEHQSCRVLPVEVQKVEDAIREPLRVGRALEQGEAGLVAIKRNQFPVDNQARGGQAGQGGGHLGKAGVERKAVAREQVDPIGVPDGKTTQPVELALVLPLAWFACARLEVGLRLHQSGEHRCDEGRFRGSHDIIASTMKALSEVSGNQVDFGYL